MSRVAFSFSVWQGARREVLRTAVFFWRSFYCRPQDQRSQRLKGKQPEGPGFFCLDAAGLGLTACFSTSLRAQQPMTPTPTAPTQVKPAPVKTPATHAAPVIPPPDSLGRYGKILTPSDEMSHPLKLKMPFPGVGEIKVPNQDELSMREKLEQLAKLSDSEIRLQLEQWPAFGKMSLRDEGAMLQRIQDFRDYRGRVAMQKAHDMGLLTLTPDQKVRFEKDYWNKRLEMERDLAKQFEPMLRVREQKLQDELFREFSLASLGPGAQAPRPGPGGPPTNKPPQAPAPVAQIKAASSAHASSSPVVQAPR